MHLLAFAIVVAVAGFILWSIGGVLVAKGRRRRRLKQLGAGCVAMLAALVFLVVAADQSARDAGFESMADQNDAKRAGITDPQVWQAQRTEVKRVANKARANEIADQEKRTREQEAAAAAKLAEAGRKKQEAATACLSDLDCIWREQSIEIAVACRMAVQSLAKWQYEWTDGWSTAPAFTAAGWHKSDLGTITAVGRQLKLQNGFGAWKPVSYRCAYDPKTKQAVEAEVF